MATDRQSTLSMDDLLAKNPVKPLEVGDVIEAKVIDMSRSEVWLDLGMYGAGLVSRRELNPGKELNVGDKVSASVLDPETELGFPLLSLRKVAKEKGWERLEQLLEEGEIATVYPYDANRGGLLVELEGIRGFLPVSQLTAEHYPRVSNADKEEILQRLHNLVKKPLKVRVLDLDRDQSKLILSEKEAIKEDTKKKLSKIKVGDEVEGSVTGSVDFGIFVTVDGIEGLVHISEISWERVTNPQAMFKVGDKVKAKVISIDDEKLSLSIKQLTEDPWLEDIKKLKVGTVVKGKITRITPFGAFVQVTPAIEALVHISELAKGSGKESASQLEVGKEYEFKVIEIDKSARKLSLSAKNSKARSTGTKKSVTSKSKTANKSKSATPRPKK